MPPLQLGSKARKSVQQRDSYRDAEWHKMLRAGSPVSTAVPKTAKAKGYRDAEWHKLIRAGSCDAKAVQQAVKAKGCKSEAWLDMLEQGSPVAAVMRSTACVRWMPPLQLGSKSTACVRWMPPLQLGSKARKSVQQRDSYRDAEWHKMLRAGSPVSTAVPKTAKAKGYRDAEWHKLIRAGSCDAKAVQQAVKAKGCKSEAWLDMLEQGSPVAAGKTSSAAGLQQVLAEWYGMMTQCGVALPADQQRREDSHSCTSPLVTPSRLSFLNSASARSSSTQQQRRRQFANCRHLYRAQRSQAVMSRRHGRIQQPIRAR